MPTLNESIENVYQVFAAYNKPDYFPACECCLPTEEVEQLLSSDVRELTADKLSGYAADVFFTVGSLPDFKYFLPRILELCVNEEFDWPTPEVVLRKLSLADWLLWPESEQNAVLELLIVKYNVLLKDPNADDAFEEWICGLGQCVLDITIYLEPLLDRENEEKLVRFIKANPELFTEGKLSNPFWENALENHERVIVWLKQPKLDRLLAEHFNDTV